MKKLISLLLACAMIATMLIGCGNKDSSEVDNDGNSTASQGKVPDYMNELTVYPIVKQPITVKVMGAKGGANQKDWQDLDLFKKMKEITGIDLQFDTPPGTGYTEKANLALASGDVPDVFLNGWIGVKDEETYGTQGLFIPLEGYIDQYAPNVKKAFDKYPSARKASVATDGHMYSLPYICLTQTIAADILYINMDWLKKVNMSKPKTVDEFYDVIKAFKEKDPNGNGKADEMGFSFWKQGSATAGIVYDIFIAAFSGQAGGANFDVKDGKVIYNPAQPFFKDFLTYMNKLYKDGLLDPEMFSQTREQYIAKYKENKLGVSAISLSSVLDPKQPFNYELLPPLTSSGNSKMVTPELPGVTTGSFVITNKCKYPEAMMRWIDVLFTTDDNAVQGVCGLSNFLGVYGDHWKYADSSKKTYTRESKIEGMTPVDYISSYVIPGGFGLVVTDAVPDADPLLLLKATESAKNYFPYTVPTFPGSIRYSGDDNSKVALLENDLGTYVGQQIAKFIIGEEPLSKWDSYLSNIKQLKLDELLKIKQEAYDRYNK